MKILHSISKQTRFSNQMEFNPVCLSIQSTMNQYKIHNFESRSKTQNKTALNTNTIFLIIDNDKTVQYNGNFFYYNCPLSVKNLDFLTKIFQWQTNNSDASIFDGEEYISVNSSQKLYLYKISLKNNQQRTKAVGELAADATGLSCILTSYFDNFLKDIYGTLDLKERFEDLEDEVDDQEADEVVDMLDEEEAEIVNEIADLEESDNPLSFLLEETADKGVDKFFEFIEEELGLS